MPISLTETAKEIAQAAALVDEHLDNEYRTRVLQDFEEDGAAITETVKIGDREVEVPRITLRDHTRLEAEEIEISLESDVNLEGRRVDGSGNVQAAVEEGMGERRDRFEIMVTLKQGIDPTAAHISLKCRFLRRPGAEGAAQVNDALVKQLAERLT